MSKSLVFALVALPWIAWAQGPEAPSGVRGPANATASLSLSDSAVQATTPPPHSRVKRGLLTSLGGAGGALVAGGLTGGIYGLACRTDYCGFAALAWGFAGMAVGLPLGAWLTGTYLADGNGSFLGTFSGALAGFLMSATLHLIPKLPDGARIAIMALNVVAPLAGASLVYELTSQESASQARTGRLTRFGLAPTAIEGSNQARIPGLALSGSFH